MMNGPTSTDTCINANSQSSEQLKKAQENLAKLFARNMRLYTCDDCLSVSTQEADALMRSILYALGIEPEEGLSQAAVKLLCSSDIEREYQRVLALLDRRVAETMDLWREVVVAMPPFENIALWDTLESIRHLPACYDTRFAAHEVPCNIDYQLQRPVPDSYEGIDYIHEWLTRLLGEAKRLQAYDFDEACVELSRACPDYRGLLVNLLDVLEAPR